MSIELTFNFQFYSSIPISIEAAVVSHIQDFGDAIPSHARNAASHARDADAGVGHVHL